MNFYHINVDILCSKYPSFKESVLNKFTRSLDMIISNSKSGLPTAVLDGKFIHSNHEPIKEAERLVLSEISTKSVACIIEGFGLGYYAEAILKLKPGMLVVIVEPSAERFLKSLEARDLSSIFTSNLVSLLIATKSEAIRLLLPSFPKGSIQVFKHRSLYELDCEYYKEIDKIVHNFVSRKEVNTATLKKFGKLWVRNLIHNLALMPTAIDVGVLSGILGNYPVLLLAAGASLDNILPHIEELQKRFVIVAVDTSVAALMSVGYSADFTVVVDPQYWNTRHLDRIDLSRTILMSESSTNPGIFKKKHNKLFFCGSLFPLGIFFEKYGGSKKRLGAGGSVSTTAWDFCRLISSGHLFCGGLDLGFPENKTHFHGSFFEERFHTLSSKIAPTEDYAYKAVSSGRPFKRKNNTGTCTLTDNRLSIYIQWFEEQIKINNISNIWNISPLGIKLEGMDYKDLDRLLDYPIIRGEIDSIIERIEKISAGTIEKIDMALTLGTNILKDELERLSMLTDKGIILISKYTSKKQDNISIQMLLESLDKIDKQIMESDSKEITSFLLQPIIDDITGKDSATTFDKEIRNSKKLYSKIKESVDFHLSLVMFYRQNHNN